MCQRVTSHGPNPATMPGARRRKTVDPTAALSLRCSKARKRRTHALHRRTSPCLDLPGVACVQECAEIADLRLLGNTDLLAHQLVVDAALHVPEHSDRRCSARCAC